MPERTAVTGARGKVRRVIVVGGGLAGLMTTIKLCEANVPVLLVSLMPVKRSHSVCAQGGINASVNEGEGDSPAIHMEETIYAGDFLANQPPVQGMARAAPELVHLLDRMGVPFNRTPEGRLDFRRFGGSLFHRTAFAGATTGQQLLYALDEQVRRYETIDATDARGISVPGEKLVHKLEPWDFLSLVRDDQGVAIGIVAQNLRSMRIEAFRGDGVCLATGGPGAVFGRSTNSVICTGTAAAAVFQQGAVYANGEFVQVHPTAIPGADKLRLISESARGEGGRIWVPRNARDARSPGDIPELERDYFLERLYPGYGNLVPRDIASRALFQVGFHEGRGIFNPRTDKNELEVYLDLTHLDPVLLRRKLSGILEIYQKFEGEDPYTQPMRVFPAVHYSMGGLWVDYETDSEGSVVAQSPRNHAASIPGLYAVGEVDFQYHGANRLGANSLLSCLYGGQLAGPALRAYQSALARSATDLPASLFDREKAHESERFDEIMERAQSEKSTENAHALHAELGEAMLRDCTIERHDAALRELLGKLDELGERARRIRVTDRSGRANQSAQFVRHFQNMLVLARVIAGGALQRNECRGAHYKPACDPDVTPGGVGRDDQNWLRTTLAVATETGEPRFVRSFDYECAGRTVKVTDEVDTSLTQPRARRYQQAGEANTAGRGPSRVAHGSRSEQTERGHGEEEG
jgi:succinate dehydrogenase / fumarate reductase flavoprotein subunit